MLLASRTRAADALQPSHQCLPDETVFVIRVPEGRKFVDAFREQTKLGSVLLSQKRFEGIVNLIREQAGEGLTKVHGVAVEIQSEDRGLSQAIRQGSRLCRGRRAAPRAVPAGHRPGLGRARRRPGQRLMAALAQSVDEEKDSGSACGGVDIDIDGQQVIHVATPMKGPAMSPHFDVDSCDNLDEDQVKAKLEEQRRKRRPRRSRSRSTRYAHSLLRVGDRMLIGTTIPQSETEVRELLGDDPEKTIDLGAITGLEEAKGVFVRFLKAHSSRRPA